MNMTLKQIEAFYWSAQLRSLTRAAERLCAAQPAMSARIMELERTLGVELFVRSRRGLQPTPKGRQFQIYAEKILALTNDVQLHVCNESEISGFVRIGACDAIALSWLPRLLRESLKRFPQIELEFVIDLSTHLWVRLVEGTLDLSMQAGTPTHPELICRPLGVMSNKWMASPDLEHLKGIATPAGLSNVPIIVTHSRASHLMVEVQQWFREQGTSPGRLVSCNSMASAVKLTCAGIGVGVFPTTIVQDELEEGRLVVLDILPPLPETSFLVAYSGAHIPATTMAIANLAGEIASRLGEC